MEKFAIAKKIAINKNFQKELDLSINPYKLTSLEATQPTVGVPKISIFLKAKVAATKKDSPIDSQPVTLTNQTTTPTNPSTTPTNQTTTPVNDTYTNQLFKKVKLQMDQTKDPNNESPIKPTAQLKTKIKLKPQIEQQIIDDETDEKYQIDLKKFNLWSEKYRPRDLNQIVGNQEQIKQIREWFNLFKLKDNTIKKALLFSGCPGTSKTTVAHAILREFGYSIKEYNASDVRSKKLVEANLDKLITMDQVDKQFKANFRPFGIIMDEVDGMSSGDKGGMTQLIKIINPNRGKRSVKKEDKQKVNDRWIPPLICICNNNYDRKISELKKDCLEIKFNKPSVSELALVIENVCKNEGFKITEAGKKIVSELAQGDFRRLMFLLQNFSQIKKEQIDANDIYEYYDVISKKSLDLNTYEVTNRLFSKLSSVEETLKLYETDKSLLPMMVHENYVEVVSSQNTKANYKMLNLQHCIDSVITGDIIEKIMYNTQSWHLQPIHGLNACYVPSYYANVHPKLGYDRVKFTSTLGRFSLQRANIKNINLVMSMLNRGSTYNVDDIQLLSQIILFHLLDPNGDQQIGIQYLKNYNLSIKDLEKLIKMNKLDDKYKKLYKSRQKTQLTKLFGDIAQKEIHVISYNSNTNTAARSFNLNGSAVSKKGKKKSEDDDDDDNGDNGEDDEEIEPDSDNENNEDIDNENNFSGDEINNEVKSKGRKPKSTTKTTTTGKRKYTKKKMAVLPHVVPTIPKQKILLKKIPITL